MTPEQAQAIINGVDMLSTILVTAVAFFSWLHGFNSGFQR